MFRKSAMPMSSSSSGRGYSILHQTNFERLIDCVTPCLPLHSSHHHHLRGVNAFSSDGLPVGDEPVPYFNLSDLWQGFHEASAYGVGTRVLFDDGDLVTQYYTPFLSAVQIYTVRPCASTRCDSDTSWSDDNESEKVSVSHSGSSSPTWEAHSNGTVDNSASLSSDMRCNLYLSYCEYASPFWRVPFYEKIVEFAQTRPELMTLKSSDLSPSSWLSVLWYPVYNIPSQKRTKDLSTIFLAFYNLSSSFIGDKASDKGTMSYKTDMIDLQPFGLSTFKMSGNTWLNKESDAEKISSLQNAAISWLKDLSFFHHDFSFYLTQSAELHLFSENSAEPTRISVSISCLNKDYKEAQHQRQLHRISLKVTLEIKRKRKKKQKLVFLHLGFMSSWQHF